MKAWAGVMLAKTEREVANVAIIQERLNQAEWYRVVRECKLGSCLYLIAV